MESIKNFQQHLLEIARHSFEDRSIPEAIEQAFLATPRHRFIQRYRLFGSREWAIVDDSNLEQHLATLYHDQALGLVADQNGETISSISQPSLVLSMLDMLQLKPGQTVFELGAGSGWNAALMGHLVGPEGHVYSAEILSEQAQAATANIAALGLANVTIIETDGGAGYAAGTPYDRVIFTAGTYDLPGFFYDQIKDHGLLLVVIKIEGGGDTLFLLKKTADHFEAIDSLPCGFVPMTGQYALADLKPIDLATWPVWADLKNQAVAHRPFWWGNKGRHIWWRTLAIRSFLNIAEPYYQSFQEKPTENAQPTNFFGLWLAAEQSLVLAREEQLVAYGNMLAHDRLLADIYRWVEYGMPSAACLGLAVYPADYPIAAGENEWLTQRRESKFLWRLA